MSLSEHNLSMLAERGSPNFYCHQERNCDTLSQEESEDYRKPLSYQPRSRPPRKRFLMCLGPICSGATNKCQVHGPVVSVPDEHQTQAFWNVDLLPGTVLSLLTKKNLHQCPLYYYCSGFHGWEQNPSFLHSIISILFLPRKLWRLNFISMWVFIKFTLFPEE